MTKRRRTLIINRRFQFRFAFFVSSWVIVLAMFFPSVLLNFIDTFTSMIARHSDASVMAAIDNFKQESIFAVVLVSVIFCLIIFILSIYISHRIAGPVYRIQQALNRWPKGAIEQNIKFRKHDHFIELSESYNLAAAKYSDTLQKSKYAKDRLLTIAKELDQRHAAIVTEIANEL